MPVSEATYERLALEDIEGQWELVCGRPRQKPGMTQDHNSVARRLGFELQSQLGMNAFEVAVNTARLRTPAGNHYIPDVVVIPTSLMANSWGTGRLQAYAAAVPFVAEVWSPSTGGYDIDEKLPDYRERGDIEVWRIHPVTREVTFWRCQLDGSYVEEQAVAGTVPVGSLPGVSIEIDRLFRRA